MVSLTLRGAHRDCHMHSNSVLLVVIQAKQGIYFFMRRLLKRIAAALFLGAALFAQAQTAAQPPVRVAFEPPTRRRSRSQRSQAAPAHRVEPDADRSFAALVCLASLSYQVHEIR